MANTTICSKCGAEAGCTIYEGKPNWDYWIGGYCPSCRRVKNKEWTANNRERHLELNRSRNAKLRKDVIGHYSSGLFKCACCGEATEQFLTIDHINGDGAAHRRDIAQGRHPGAGNLYWWLRKNDFPPGFQVLCFNCNCAIGIHGTCPHKQ